MSARKSGLNKGRGLEALIGGGGRKKTTAPAENAEKTEINADNTDAKEEKTEKEAKTDKKGKAEKPAKEKNTKETKRKGKAADATAKNEPEKKLLIKEETQEETSEYGPEKENEVEEEELTPEKEVSISLIIPNSEQPRREFDDASIEELGESIKIHGILQPLLVQKKGKYYEIIAGERRWRAAKLVGLKKVPVIVRSYTPKQTLEISLIENIQRQDLNPIDEAFAYKRLLEEFSLTQADVAKRVSKSRAVITNALRLLKLDERVQRMLIDNLVTTGHARALLSIEDGEVQFEIANKIASEGMNVRDTEKYINSLKKRPIQRKRTDTTQMTSVYAPIEEQLKEILGTKVTVKPRSIGRGSIDIEYYSGEDLERILDIISRGGEDQQ